MASPVPPTAAPAPKSSSGPLYALIGCLAVLFIALLAGAAVVVFVWHPWAPDVKPPPPGTAEGTVTTGETTGTDEGSETTAGTSSLELIAGNTAANGASYKLFANSGTVAASGSIPDTVDVAADSRYKLVVGKSGYRSWEAWQTIGGAGSSQHIAVTLEELPPDMVTVSVCTTTGRRANEWCPTTTRKDFRKGDEPGVCTVHKAPPGQVGVKICTTSGQRANQYCPTVVTRTFDANRVPGYCTVHKPPPPPQSTVSVRICDDSGQKSGPYCTSTHVEERAKSDTPGKCQMHAAPPPKPSADADQYKWCPQCDARNRVNARLCRKCNYRF